MKPLQTVFIFYIDDVVIRNIIQFYIQLGHAL